jgi:tRNA G10  N-methylase Trm11
MGQKYRKQEETIRNNLKQYDLEDKFLDVLVADFSTTYIKNTLKFDSIVTDPPYVNNWMKIKIKIYFLICFKLKRESEKKLRKSAVKTINQKKM